ncbi:FMN-binding domain-containing protein [Bifidobacterium sp. DSM 109958]|uniref:FMN-binding domain-containing protein n=1 Tax=Bifidobacterium moraviense TaxID=2675323 RepID=A0A7Y0F2Z6_9BIFI|nr:FMN-binding protein [Bifidobacterium sp. DSM 109958]NMN01079.1 FMN-binding domain-containing protein [Bifidobacterium sp. DSM 109958]
MNANATKTLIAVVAGLAVIGDAFLLFVKPQLTGSRTAVGTGAAASGAISGSSSRAQSPATPSQPVSPSTSGSASADADASTTTLKDGTYTSVATPNEYGEVQLQVTVSGGSITDIAAVAYPNHTSRSQGISAQAIPQLIDRAISAQSSDIQFVSGATETSTAFVNSLQDAINQSLNAGQ